MKERRNFDIPVAVFAYARPDLLENLLTCLKRELISSLYVFSDGPECHRVAPRVAQVRKLIHEVDWCEVVISERSENFGLGHSIRSGVAEVLRHHDEIIVFEDDLQCVPGTYQYLCAALDRYRDDERVMSVTGWTHPRIVPADVHDLPYFDGKAECWAWGTWVRSWHGMDATALESMNQCLAKGIDVEKYGTDMPKMAAEAELRNLWAIGWFYLHLLKDGLCLRPPWSMVEHSGWDERSTTTTPAMMRWMNPQLRAAPPLPDHWPIPSEHFECARLWRLAIDSPQ